MRTRRHRPSRRALPVHESRVVLAAIVGFALAISTGSVHGVRSARADTAKPAPSDEPAEPDERRPIGHDDETPHENKQAQPCRPTISCTADIVAPGDLEIESGVVTRKQRTGFSLSAPLLLKYSLSHELQFQLGGNTLTAIRTTQRSTYFDNAVGTLKVHIVDQTAKRPSLALSGSLSVPTFKAAGYERAYDGIFTAYATKDIGPVHLDLNVGVNAAGFDKVATGQGYVALAAGTDVGEGFGGHVEGYVFSDAQPYASRDSGVVFVLTQSPEPWLVFDVGADVSLYTSTRLYSTFFGVTLVPVTLGE